MPRLVRRRRHRAVLASRPWPDYLPRTQRAYDPASDGIGLRVIMPNAVTQNGLGLGDLGSDSIPPIRSLGACGLDYCGAPFAVFFNVYGPAGVLTRTPWLGSRLRCALLVLRSWRPVTFPSNTSSVQQLLLLSMVAAVPVSLYFFSSISSPHFTPLRGRRLLLIKPQIINEELVEQRGKQSCRRGIG